MPAQQQQQLLSALCIRQLHQLLRNPDRQTVVYIRLLFEQDSSVHEL